MSEHVSEQSSIVYSVRLPKDPPRTFDITRLPLRMIYDSANVVNMENALRPICHLVGLPDYNIMLRNDCGNNAAWQEARANSRCMWIVMWLIREDLARNPKK